MFVLSYNVGKARSGELSGKETSSFVRSGSMSSSSRSLSNAFQVSFFTTTNFENAYRTISTKLCVFEGNQIYLRISELEKIRSSKVDVLLNETKLDSIGIMRQNNDYSLNSSDTSYKTKSNNYFHFHLCSCIRASTCPKS